MYDGYPSILSKAVPPGECGHVLYHDTLSSCVKLIRWQSRALSHQDPPRTTRSENFQELGFGKQEITPVSTRGRRWRVMLSSGWGRLAAELKGKKLTGREECGCVTCRQKPWCDLPVSEGEMEKKGSSVWCLLCSSSCEAHVLRCLWGPLHSYNTSHSAGFGWRASLLFAEKME